MTQIMMTVANAPHTRRIFLPSDPPREDETRILPDVAQRSQQPLKCRRITALSLPPVIVAVVVARHMHLHETRIGGTAMATASPPVIRVRQPLETRPATKPAIRTSTSLNSDRLPLDSGQEPDVLGGSHVVPPRSENVGQFGLHRLCAEAERSLRVQGPGYVLAAGSRPAQFLIASVEVSVMPSSRREAKSASRLASPFQHGRHQRKEVVPHEIAGFRQ